MGSNNVVTPEINHFGTPMTGLHHEKNRLDTFRQWPAEAPLDAQRIAKAGFFYSGNQLEVQCFSCGGKISQWNYGDVAMMKHRILNPNCPFVKNESENVPLIENSISDDETRLPNGHAYQREDDDIRRSSDSGYVSAPVTGSAGSSRLTLATGFNFPPSYTTKTWHTFDFLKHESERLKTFIGWPETVDFIRPEDLAKSGFFFLRDGDKVQCAFCRGVVGEWEPGDVPMTEHCRHFPNCPFVLSLPVGNIELGHDVTTDVGIPLQQSEGCDTCERYNYEVRPTSRPEQMANLGGSFNIKRLSSEDDVNFEELGISPHHGPKHAAYATYESRLRTFTSWPSGMSQSPEILAEAGLFYAGISDHVKCFHCGGGLRNWNRLDDPWIEHARWFQTCSFVLLVKGDEFIQDAIRRFPPNLPPAAVSQLAAHSSHAETSAPRNFFRTVTESELEGLLHHAVCKGALDIGIDRGLVKMALKRKMETTGLPFSDLSTLLNVAFMLQAAGQERIEVEMPSVGGLANGHHEQSLPISEEIHSIGRMHIESSSEDSGVEDGTVVAAVTEPQEDSSGEAIEVPVSGDVNNVAAVTEKTEDKYGTSVPLLDVTMEEEYRLLKEQRLCKICMDEDVGVVFLPCGHLIACVHCAPSLRDCPLCRKTIKGTVRTYMS